MDVNNDNSTVRFLDYGTSENQQVKNDACKRNQKPYEHVVFILYID